MLSGRRTSAEMCTIRNPSRNAPSASGKRVDDPEHRLAEGREREHGRNGQPERDVGEDRAIARVVIAAGQLLAARTVRPFSHVSVSITALNKPLTDARFTTDLHSV